MRNRCGLVEAIPIEFLLPEIVVIGTVRQTASIHLPTDPGRPDIPVGVGMLFSLKRKKPIPTVKGENGLRYPWRWSGGNTTYAINECKSLRNDLTLPEYPCNDFSSRPRFQLELPEISRREIRTV